MSDWSNPLLTSPLIVFPFSLFSSIPIGGHPVIFHIIHIISSGAHEGAALPIHSRRYARRNEEQVRAVALSRPKQIAALIGTASRWPESCRSNGGAVARLQDAVGGVTSWRSCCVRSLEDRGGLSVTRRDLTEDGEKLLAATRWRGGVTQARRRDEESLDLWIATLCCSNSRQKRKRREGKKERKKKKRGTAAAGIYGAGGRR
ncbi:hypothetical protein JCGZ_08641 [Jatropha curcas]|uniref:Uncharacterized protein n=1 Tax=Jatropha curcas TaxID=180498 RepID=A0A067JL87_JATCU|nr:hypothetical protein JCGZ_08641 [Jatropha curcas]